MAKTLIVQCSAFWKTFQRQYMNAAIHKNHSRKAAIMTTPTMDVYTIWRQQHASQSRIETTLCRCLGRFWPGGVRTSGTCHSAAMSDIVMGENGNEARRAGRQLLSNAR